MASSWCILPLVSGLQRPVRWRAALRTLRGRRAQVVSAEFTNVPSPFFQSVQSANRNGRRSREQYADEPEWNKQVRLFDVRVRPHNAEAKIPNPPWRSIKAWLILLHTPGDAMGSRVLRWIILPGDHDAAPLGS